MMRLFIEPTEPLLFRTGRPFNAGENNFAETIFPPTPETMQGAVRAAIATHWDRTKTIAQVFEDPELVELIGNRKGYGRFRITSLALGRRKNSDSEDGPVERLFPSPLYLQKDRKKVIRFYPKPITEVRSDIPEDMWYLWPDEEAEDKLENAGWLTERGLVRVLRDKEKPFDEEIVSNREIFEYESRLGIGMNNETKTTREGLLYQVRMVRMKHDLDFTNRDNDFVYGFVVDISLAGTEESACLTDSPETLLSDEQVQKQLRLPDSGWITLGGERRAAYFRVLKSVTLSASENVEQLKAGRAVYLSTPAALDDGWKPLNWQPKKWSKPLPKPIAVTIDRYQPIGGWLLAPGTAGGENKIMRRCVPAGSVYFFNEPVAIERPFTDYGWQIGYGIAYAGEWKS
ncbi:MAG TPA: type III-B CRISPR module-associated protein Cmr3 [Ktedonobacteraceae bacterium]|nr:type III-B CRISPR module-associated protein Cmr3 [Ktedonobacteraceae bacterium]